MEDWDAGRLMKLSGGYWATCALHAGVKLDVFSKIGEGKATAGKLAGEMGTDERALGMLLNALTAMGLLDKRDGGFLNTPASKNYLSKGSLEYVGHMILHHHYLVESWAKLDDAVRTGKSVRGRAWREDAERREAFLMGMFNTAMGMAPLIVPKVDLAGRKRLLDLGGGPGTYALMFCRENPELKAVVYDLPASRPFAEKTIDRFGLKDRVAFEAGDYLADPVPGGFDAVWLSHILHAEPPEGCATIIGKAASALGPGGLLLIHDFYLKDTMDGPVFPALFTLNMLLGTDGGQSYSEGQVREMMSSAGFGDITRLPVSTPTDSGVLAGVKAG